LPDSIHFFTLAGLQTDCTALLIPEYDTDDQAHQIIKKISKELFERELDSYCTDPDWWPSNRDYKTFLKWFDIELHSAVFDTMDREIIKGFEVNTLEIGANV
jgi:hypothetical protein